MMMCIQSFINYIFNYAILDDNEYYKMKLTPQEGPDVQDQNINYWKIRELKRNNIINRMSWTKNI